MKKYIYYNGAEKDLSLFIDCLQGEKKDDYWIIGAPAFFSARKGDNYKIINCSAAELLKKKKYYQLFLYLIYRKKLLLSEKCQLVYIKNNTAIIHNIDEEIKDLLDSDKNVIGVRFRSTDGWGMYSMIGSAFKYLRYAYDNNLEVYFDMLNYPTTYNEKIGENAWDYYYAQSQHMSDNKNIVYCDSLKLPEQYEKIDRSLETLISQSKYYKKYIILNDEMQRIVCEQWQRICDKSNNGKILGIKFRGTDYKKGRIPAGHAIQSTVSEMISAAEKMMLEIGYHYLYLAVEEQEIINSFIDYFGENKVLFYDCKYIEEYDGIKPAGVVQLELVGRKKSGEDYIGTIECLSRCHSLLANYTGSTCFAIIMNGGEYEHVNIIDNGLSK